MFAGDRRKNQDDLYEDYSPKRTHRRVIRNMAVKDQTLTFVRNALTGLNPDCRVIVAPSVVGVYVNKSRDVLMKTALSHHWKFQYRGLLCLIYHPILNRLKLVVADEKSARMLWQETFGDYTDYESIHAVFHILNSSKNFCQKIGLFYGDEKVANMVQHTMDAFTAQRRREQARGDRSGKLLARSRSFNSTERVKVDVKLTRSYSNSLGDIKLHRTALNLLEDEAEKYVKQGSRRSSLKKMFSGIRSSFRVRIRRQETSETENERRKRSRLSPGASPDEEEMSGIESRLSQNSTKFTNIETSLDGLSANWKLSDVELEELYRLSYFKEDNNVPSTDLCTTEL